MDRLDKGFADRFPDVLPHADDAAGRTHADHLPVVGNFVEGGAHRHPALPNAAFPSKGTSISPASIVLLRWSTASNA